MKAELSQRGLEPDERDFFKETFTEGELRGILGDTPPSEIFSWRSPSVKKMGLNRDELTDEQLIGLMLEEPRLIRRPLIVVDRKLVVGTDRKAMAQAFLD